MILNLYTEDFFDSSHNLINYDGKCANSHGHSFKICVWIKGDESELDKSGILWDFSNIKKITNEFDHKNLNEIVDFNPTVENLTLYTYKKLKKINSNLLFKVRIYEQVVSKNAYCETGDF